MSDMYTNNIEFDTRPDIEKEGGRLWFLMPLKVTFSSTNVFQLYRIEKDVY